MNYGRKLIDAYKSHRSLVVSFMWGAVIATLCAQFYVSYKLGEALNNPIDDYGTKLILIFVLLFGAGKIQKQKQT